MNVPRHDVACVKLKDSKAASAVVAGGFAFLPHRAFLGQSLGCQTGGEMGFEITSPTHGSDQQSTTTASGFFAALRAKSTAQVKRHRPGTGRAAQRFSRGRSAAERHYAAGRASGADRSWILHSVKAGATPTRLLGPPCVYLPALRCV